MSQANVHETVVMISEDPTNPVSNCSLLGNSALLGFTFPKDKVGLMVRASFTMLS